MIYTDKNYKNYEMISKHFRCSIWGEIHVSPIALQIIDSWEFQRLHYIRQTGFSYKVFPSSTTSRFEHSLGVYHVTRKIIDHVQTNIPESLKISDWKKELICIVGLVHDLGHGAFSHLFDTLLENCRTTMIPKKHEDRSCIIFKRIVKKYSIGLSGDDVEWVCERISNPPNEMWYDTLVCNPYSSFDTDKVDYLIRDARHFGIVSSFDIHRILENIRIIDGQLCFCDRVFLDVKKMFKMRDEMHRSIYRHPTTQKFDKFLLSKLRRHDFSQLSLDSFLELYDSRLLEMLHPDERIEMETRTWTQFSDVLDSNVYFDNQTQMAMKNMKWFQRKNPSVSFFMDQLTSNVGGNCV